MKKKLFTKSQIEAYLIKKNPLLFENPIPATAHSVIVTGRNEKKGEDWRERFITRTTPNQAALDAGVAAGNYIRASVERQIDRSNGFRGDRAPVAANIFESAQKSMFIYFKDELINTNYTHLAKGTAAKDGQKDLPIIRMNQPVYGAIITISVPAYKLQTVDKATGRRSDWKGARYNHFTGKYEKDTNVKDTVTFFSDETDLSKLLSECVKIFENQVEPYLVGDAKQVVVEGMVIEEEIINNTIQDERDLTSTDDTTEDDVVEDTNDENLP